MRNRQPATHVSRRLLANYFEHKLPEVQEMEIEEHLADCEECVKLARVVRQFTRFLQTLGTENPNRGVSFDS